MLYSQGILIRRNQSETWTFSSSTRRRDRLRDRLPEPDLKYISVDSAHREFHPGSRDLATRQSARTIPEAPHQSARASPEIALRLPSTAAAQTHHRRAIPPVPCSIRKLLQAVLVEHL